MFRSVPDLAQQMFRSVTDPIEFELVLQDCHRCYHCKNKFSTSIEAVRHCLKEHDSKELSILVPTTRDNRTVFIFQYHPVQPRQCSC